MHYTWNSSRSMDDVHRGLWRAAVYPVHSSVNFTFLRSSVRDEHVSVVVHDGRQWLHIEPGYILNRVRLTAFSSRVVER